MDHDRMIEILTLEVDVLGKLKIVLEAALVALMRERWRELKEQAAKFHGGEEAV